MGKRRLLSLYFLICCLSCLLVQLVASQKLSEEEPLEGNGSGFNPDDEDFAESGLPPDSAANDAHGHHGHAVTKPNSFKTSSETTSTPTSIASQTVSSMKRPSDVTTEAPGPGKGAFNSFHLILGASVLIVLLLILTLLLVRCCCRRSTNRDYTQGTTRSKNYV